ncbi:hypothetical protein BDY17DRAFT_320261 [Neohortaea acidophila]|uniref:Uncharacterized protein n=1 Tax=Neohortaea acidophila TaxID=245834 RepID=A0A6A6Q6X8_9PEZI|nr:uncharacterized protein BDY17DRAFT_320261 [Neohortaea acidophila]KAF2487744.1 hypothetical protein BDY17DRAFT_320261 [Neohortaea acidophila]
MAESNQLGDRLMQHLQSVQASPSTPLDTRLLEEADLILPKTLQGNERLVLIQTLAGLLPELQQDPTPAVNILLHLLDDLSYSDILNFGSLPYTEGLAVGEHMVSFNRLIISILEKATRKPTDAAHVASMLDTMLALVRLWLCTPDTGIASQASTLLLDLLKVDQEIQTHPDAHLPAGGQGLVWKRIFGDRNIYATLFEACSHTGPSTLKLSKNQRTLAQARLMEWLPAVGAMDWSAISRSHHPDVEAAYGVQEGLLEFAVLRMVDYEDDVLMNRCLIDFYSELLRTTRPPVADASIAQESPALLYLITHDVHTRTAAIYLQLPGVRVDPVEAMFLYGPAANYIATYASYFPDHYLASRMARQVNERLMRVFDLSPAKWAHAESPKHDLHLAASLPRKILLPTREGTVAWDQSPLSLLPSRASNDDVLNTLATIFHGPERQIVSFPPSSPLTTANEVDQKEAASARALYFHYLANNPQFWRNIAIHADTVALKDLALAAIRCLTAVITANWATKTDVALPTTIATSDSGALAILTPPSLEYSLPYLLKPPQTFSNLVGGRGDAESAAYKIASAKFDALRTMHARVATLVKQRPGEGFEDILTTLTKRLNDGPLSREGEVGGRIGTLEL